jgi:hypothetical protein
LRQQAKAIAISLVVAINLTLASSAYAAFPRVTGVAEAGVVQTNDLVKLNGSDLNQLNAVFIDDVETSFFVNSDTRITIRIPFGIDPGDANLTLVSNSGQQTFQNILEIVARELPADSKITVGTFQGFVAVYTKGLKGSKLSIRIGSKWRQIEQIKVDYSKNLTRVGANRIVSVEVYVNGELVKVEHLVSQ